MTEITRIYSKLTRIDFQLTEREVRGHLIDAMAREYPDLLVGGVWTFDWLDEETQGALVVKLAYVIEEPTEEPT